MSDQGGSLTVRISDVRGEAQAVETSSAWTKEEPHWCGELVAPLKPSSRPCVATVGWIGDVNQSKQNHVPFGHLLKKTVWPLSIKNQI